MISQVPWFERRFNFDFSIQLFPVIFCRLEGSIFRLNMLLQNADEEKCSFSGSGWSVKEHIGHLSDLEPLWWSRLSDFRDHKTLLTPADLTNKKTNEAGHNNKTLEQLVVLFVAERQKMLETIYNIDEHELSLTSIHPRLQQPMRLIDALYFVAEHDDHHIAFISEQLRLQNRR